MLSSGRSSTVTRDAPPVVTLAVTFETGDRVDSPVDPVPGKIVSPMGHSAPRLVFVFVARLELFLVGVAVGTEGLGVTGHAECLVPPGLKTVGRGEISGVIVGRLPFAVTLAAEGGPVQLLGMGSGKAPGAGTGSGKESQNHGGEESAFHLPPSHFFSSRLPEKAEKR
jgi:hypothetical protein